MLASILSPLSLTAQAKVEAAPATDAPVVQTNAFTQITHAVVASASVQLAEATQQTLATRTTYTLAAEHGDGITNLARKAVHEYLVDINRANEYDRAQRIFVEDFLQNRIGTYWLALGQEETFTVDQIQAALADVVKVDTSSLQANLAQFVAKVDWQKYETLAFAHAKEDTSSESDKNQGDSATTDQNKGTTDTEAAQTQNTNSNTTRTVVYVIIVLIVLAIAGYLLFKGQEDGEMPKLDLMKKDTSEKPKTPEAPKTETNTDYTKSENSDKPGGPSAQ